MHKDIPVLNADYSTKNHKFLEIHEMIDAKHLPVGCSPNGEFSLKALTIGFAGVVFLDTVLDFYSCRIVYRLILQWNC